MSRPEPNSRTGRTASEIKGKSKQSPIPSQGRQNGRKALAVDPEIKSSNLNRLRRIEGQIRGLHKMVEGDRYCPDILVQISSVQEALRGVGRALMRNHLQHCATDALANGTQEQARQMYDELLELIYRYLR
jgi:CsoR family transcriptional regulator, copper-sensing transcriptional repressor